MPINRLLTHAICSDVKTFVVWVKYCMPRHRRILQDFVCGCVLGALGALSDPQTTWFLLAPTLCYVHLTSEQEVSAAGSCRGGGACAQVNPYRRTRPQWQPASGYSGNWVPSPLSPMHPLATKSMAHISAWETLKHPCGDVAARTLPLSPHRCPHGAGPAQVHQLGVMGGGGVWAPRAAISARYRANLHIGSTPWRVPRARRGFKW